MNSRRLTIFVAVAVVLLVSWAPRLSRAATHTTYKAEVIYAGPGIEAKVQGILDQRASQEWQLQSASTFVPEGDGGLPSTQPGVLLIFKKE
jgi:hypothetical protein